MDKIVKNSDDNSGFSIGNSKVRNLLFADDLGKFDTNESSLQNGIELLNTEFQKAKMKISVSKTESMVIGRDSSVCNIKVNGETIAQKDHFKYLGVEFNSDGKQDREISRRLVSASIVFKNLEKLIITKKELSIKAKIAIYKTIYVPNLIYGHESWILTDRVRSRIQAAEMRYLRKILGINRLDKVKNSVIREKLGLEPLILKIEKSQLRWAGHVFRMGNDRKVREIFVAEPTEESRRPGRPRKTWRKQFKEILERLELSETEAIEMSKDRLKWKRKVESLRPRPERKSGRQ